MKKFIVLFLLCFSFQGLMAFEADNEPLKKYFQGKLDTINSFMAENHKKVQNQPDLLIDFVNKDLLTVWSAEHTVRAMLGNERWQKLENNQQNQMISVYEDTMRRYLFEVMSKYSGQVAKAESVRLNGRANKGWLRVLLVIENFPDLAVDLKIFNPNVKPEIVSKHQDWFIYDFSFQGISFVKMKQDYFRETFDDKGFEQLLSELNLKNQEFKNLTLAAD